MKSGLLASMFIGAAALITLGCGLEAKAGGPQESVASEEAPCFWNSKQKITGEVTSTLPLDPEYVGKLGGLWQVTHSIDRKGATKLTDPGTDLRIHFTAETFAWCQSITAPITMKPTYNQANITIDEEGVITAGKRRLYQVVGFEGDTMILRNLAVAKTFYFLRRMD